MDIPVPLSNLTTEQPKKWKRYFLPQLFLFFFFLLAEEKKILIYEGVMRSLHKGPQLCVS